METNIQIYSQTMKMYHFTHIQIVQKVMSSNIRLISTDIIFICIPRRKLNKNCQLQTAHQDHLHLSIFLKQGGGCYSVCKRFTCTCMPNCQISNSKSVQTIQLQILHVWLIMISGVTKNMVFESRVYVDRYSLIHCAHDHPQQSPFESDYSAVDQKSNNVSHITTCVMEAVCLSGQKVRLAMQWSWVQVLLSKIPGFVSQQPQVQILTSLPTVSFNSSQCFVQIELHVSA